MADADSQSKSPEREKPLATYQTPVLRPLGDVRSMTLGGSLGTGDSGNPGLQQF